jgi:FxsC-like protein
MASDPTPLARLADVLGRAGSHPPTATELAELLWLAGHCAVPLTAAAEVGRSARGTPSASGPRATPGTRAVTTGEEADEPVTLFTTADSVSSGTTDSGSLLAPLPPLLTHPLPLQRALRPLKRHFPAPSGRELDEERTAEAIARRGARPGTWLPVFTPSRERWLTLNLVYDVGPTMPLWRPLVRELHQTLTSTGIFRAVILWQVTPDGLVRTHLPPHRKAVVPPGDGRTATLVLSDCTGPQWRAGQAGVRWHRAVGSWARTMPVAVVQPLPEHLWRHTARPTRAGILRGDGPAAPSATTRFLPYGAARHDSPSDDVPVPVLELSAAWLGHWSTLIGAPGGAAVPAAVTALPPRPSVSEVLPGPGGGLDDLGGLNDLAPEELVRRFRSLASPQAFRLAGHLAVGEPVLPVMRLVHAAVEDRPQPGQLAEVILSGLLRAVPGPGVGWGRYEFRSGVRDLLLRTLPRSATAHTVELLTRVGTEIEARAGAMPGEFHAYASLRRPDDDRGVEGRPFALISEEALALLRGPSPTSANRRSRTRPPPPQARSRRRRVLTVTAPSATQPEPYFFLSYARRDDSDDVLVSRFYEDLVAELGRRGANCSGQPSFQDMRQLAVGADWERTLGRAVGHCRAMVALCSPAYVQSLYCGREWAAFRARLEDYRARAAIDVPALLPVLWDPLRGGMPEEIARYQYYESTMGTAYLDHGLRRLMFRDPAHYHSVLRLVAERVQSAAEQFQLPTGEVDLSTVRNPFSAPQTAVPADGDAGHVRLFVAACTTEQRPPNRRSTLYYGNSPLDWTPYHPPAHPTVAHRAQRLIIEDGLTSSLEVVDGDLGGKLDEAVRNNQPSVLLVDPWATELPAYREALRDFDRRSDLRTAVLVPRHDADEESADAALWDNLGTVFPRNWSRRDDPYDRLFRVGVDDRRFDEELVVAVTLAQRRLHQVQPAQRPSTPPAAPRPPGSAGSAPGERRPPWPL